MKVISCYQFRSPLTEIAVPEGKVIKVGHWRNVLCVWVEHEAHLEEGEMLLVIIDSGRHYDPLDARSVVKGVADRGGPCDFSVNQQWR